MTLLDDTLIAAGELGRAAASQATEATNAAVRSLSDAAHGRPVILDGLGESAAGSDRDRGRRILILAAIVAIAGLAIWWRRSAATGADDPAPPPDA